MVNILTECIEKYIDDKILYTKIYDYLCNTELNERKLTIFNFNVNNIDSELFWQYYSTMNKHRYKYYLGNNDNGYKHLYNYYIDGKTTFEIDIAIIDNTDELYLKSLLQMIIPNISDDGLLILRNDEYIKEFIKQRYFDFIEIEKYIFCQMKK